MHPVPHATHRHPLLYQSQNMSSSRQSKSTRQMLKHRDSQYRPLPEPAVNALGSLGSGSIPPADQRWPCLFHPTSHLPDRDDTSDTSPPPAQNSYLAAPVKTNRATISTEQVILRALMTLPPRRRSRGEKRLKSDRRVKRQMASELRRSGDHAARDFLCNLALAGLLPVSAASFLVRLRTVARL